MWLLDLFIVLIYEFLMLNIKKFRPIFLVLFHKYKINSNKIQKIKIMLCEQWLFHTFSPGAEENWRLSTCCKHLSEWPSSSSSCTYCVIEGTRGKTSQHCLNDVLAVNKETRAACHNISGSVVQWFSPTELLGQLAPEPTHDNQARRTHTTEKHCNGMMIKK